MNISMPPVNSDNPKCQSFKQSFENLEETKIAWLAGLLQGEAAFQLDSRVRSKTPLSLYTPPPPTPIIKLEMVEPDLMECVGKYFDKPVKLMSRKTSAGNSVYRVSVCARQQVEIILRRILPHVIGHKTRSKIESLLQICDQYNEWVTQGGKSKAAKLANEASQKARKAKKNLQ